jgi:hypothetical protein
MYSLLAGYAAVPHNLYIKYFSILSWAMILKCCMKKCSKSIIFLNITLGHQNSSYSSVLQRHCTKYWKQIFPEMKLRGIVPNSYIHEFESDLYIPTIAPPIWLQQNR